MTMYVLPLQISASDLDTIRGHLSEAYPEEGCGLLGGLDADDARLVRAVVPMPNAKTDERTRRYLIPPEEYRRAEQALADRGLEVIGFFHSHPDHPAQPSAFDLDWAWPWYSYLIVSVHAGRCGSIRAFQLREDRSGFDEQEVQPCPKS